MNTHQKISNNVGGGKLNNPSRNFPHVKTVLSLILGMQGSFVLAFAPVSSLTENPTTTPISIEYTGKFKDILTEDQKVNGVVFTQTGLENQSTHSSPPKNDRQRIVLNNESGSLGFVYTSNITDIWVKNGKTLVLLGYEPNDPNTEIMRDHHSLSYNYRESLPHVLVTEKSLFQLGWENGPKRHGSFGSLTVIDGSTLDVVNGDFVIKYDPTASLSKTRSLVRIGDIDMREMTTLNIKSGASLSVIGRDFELGKNGQLNLEGTLTTNDSNLFCLGKCNVNGDINVIKGLLANRNVMDISPTSIITVNGINNEKTKDASSFGTINNQGAITITAPDTASPIGGVFTNEANGTLTIHSQNETIKGKPFINHGKVETPNKLFVERNFINDGTVNAQTLTIQAQRSSFENSGTIKGDYLTVNGVPNSNDELATTLTNTGTLDYRVAEFTDGSHTNLASGTVNPNLEVKLAGGKLDIGHPTGSGVDVHFKTITGPMNTAITVHENGKLFLDDGTSSLAQGQLYLAKEFALNEGSLNVAHKSPTPLPAGSAHFGANSITTVDFNTLKAGNTPVLTSANGSLTVENGAKLKLINVDSAGINPTKPTRTHWALAKNFNLTNAQGSTWNGGWNNIETDSTSALNFILSWKGKNDPEDKNESAYDSNTLYLFLKNPPITPPEGGTDTPTPDTGAPTPGTDGQAPDPSTPTPGTDGTNPDTGAPTPGTDGTNPDTGTPTPGTDGTKPDTGAPTPGTDGTNPDTGAPTPGTDGTNPDTGAPTPGTDGTKPDTGAPTPGTDGTNPDTGAPTPGTDGTNPDTGTPTPGTDGTNPDTGTPTVATNVQNVVLLPSRFYFNDVDSYDERTGGLIYANNPNCPTCVWGRLQGDSTKSTRDNKAKTKSLTIQLGVERTLSDDNLWKGALFVENRRGKATFARHDQQIKQTGYGFGAILTRTENLTYWDFVARLARDKFTIESAGDKAKVRGFNLYLSAETGRRYMYQNNYFIEPQGQITYSLATLKDYVLNNQSIETDTFAGIGLRLGLKAGKECSEYKYWARVDLLPRLGIPHTITVTEEGYAPTEVKENNRGVGFDIGLGASRNLNNKWRIAGSAFYVKHPHMKYGLRAQLNLQRVF